MEADHQDRCRWVVNLQCARLAFALERVNQRVVDDLDDLLAGGDGFGDRLTRSLVFHGFDKIAGDGQGNIGLQQRNAYFAQCGFDVFLGQGTLFGEAVKNAGQAFGEILKHGPWPPSVGCGSSLNRTPAFNTQMPPRA